LNEHPNSLIQIYGHTDSNGTNEYNLDLSMKRAKEVEDFLKAKKVNPNKITSVGKAFTEPIYKKERYEWQASENRRVEILLWDK